MSEPRVIAERLIDAPGVLYLTFSNPDAFNSVTVEMREELIRQFTEAEKDDSIRVIVLQGAGDRCFCSAFLSLVIRKTIPPEVGSRTID